MGCHFNRFITFPFAFSILVYGNLSYTQDKKEKSPSPGEASPEQIKQAASRLQIQDKAPDNKFDALKKELLESREWALTEIHEMLGLYLPEGKTVSVVFSADWNSQFAATTTQLRDGEPPLLQLFLPGMLKTKKGKGTLLHELVHAIQFSCLSLAEQRTLPHAFFEGIAMYAGNEGPKFIEEHISLSYKGDVQKLIANLKGLESYRSPTEYVEGYLAVRYLAEKYGAGKVKQFAREITYDKKNYKASIEGVTGTPWPQFQKEAREYTVEYLKKLKKGK